MDATEEFSRDERNQAGFIAPVGEGLVEGGTLDGVPYDFGKGGGAKGKGQMQRKGGRLQTQHQMGAQGRNESVARVWQQMKVKEISREEAFLKKLTRKVGCRSAWSSEGKYLMYFRHRLRHTGHNEERENRGAVQRRSKARI